MWNIVGSTENHRRSTSLRHRGLVVASIGGCVACLVVFGFAVGKKKPRIQGAFTEMAAEVDDPPVPKSPSARIPGSSIRLEPHLAMGPAAGIGPPVPPFHNAETAAETAAKELKVLAVSGPGVPAYKYKVERLLDNWKSTSQVASLVELSDFQCFKKGCSFTATYKDQDAVQTVSRDFKESEAFIQHGSPWFRSGPIEADGGKIKTTWILFAINN